jgi:hypothetical protein
MRLTEFADPKAYSLPAEDDDDFNGRHQHERPDCATDELAPPDATRHVPGRRPIG